MEGAVAAGAVRHRLTRIRAGAGESQSITVRLRPTMQGDQRRAAVQRGGEAAATVLVRIGAGRVIAHGALRDGTFTASNAALRTAAVVRCQQGRRVVAHGRVSGDGHD